MDKVLRTEIEVNREVAQTYNRRAADALKAGFIGLSCKYKRQEKEARLWCEHYERKIRELESRLQELKERRLREEEMTKDLEDPAVAKAYGWPGH